MWENVTSRSKKLTVITPVMYIPKISKVTSKVTKYLYLKYGIVPYLATKRPVP